MGLTINNRFLIFWSILGALGFILIWNLPWRFQVNDDVIMMWLVSGAYTGTPESYAVFIHPILSWILSQLYEWKPEIQWYGAAWFLVIGLSYFLLILKLSETTYEPSQKAFLAFFILLISIHFCIFPQFTLVAGFASFSSLSLWYSRLNSHNFLIKGLTIVLFILAIMIRWESTVLMGIGFVAYRLSLEGLRFLSSNLVKLIAFGVLFLVLFGGKVYWEKNSDFADFLKFNKIRAGVIDHPVFRQEILEKRIEVNSEFYFFSRWFFEGERPTENELFEKKRILDSQFFTKDQFTNSFIRLWDFQKIEAFKSFLIAGILFLFFFSTKRSFALFSFFFIWLLFFFIFNHFYIIQGRVIFLFFLCFLFPVFEDFLPAFNNLVVKMAFLLCLIALLYHSFNFLKEAKGRAIMDREFLALNLTLESGVPLIFEGYQEHNLGIKYSSAHPVSFISTGWISRSVFQKKALIRIGLKGFEEINRFALITPTINNEIVFPEYMSHTFGDFRMLDSVKTDNFLLMEFVKK
ncbi:hypothetical protein D0X99_19485 [Algoriphagus lacus]|uniref:Glycosyltransferase RgtA/B/C/D-like domain-containing protein n=1 Tax=Algoriphagus lacus TaxID=2056311 RepID=A0A418PM95_9BACT|nr:hypothetical protein [Algoriphagus lacus]RIW12267.1 hypothetical protein D0X99_19485 [Algoriphagus lacus]